MRLTEPNSIEWHRTWWHEEPRVVTGLELFAEVRGLGTHEAHLLPGTLYNGNAGSVADRLVPRVLGGAPNLFEEHRYPVPMAHLELRARSGLLYGLTLETRPNSVVDGHLPDQWWSLGFEPRGDGGMPSLLSVSGRLSMNGEDESFYDSVNRQSPYRDAWVDAKPRQCHEKHYRLHLQAIVPARRSWRFPLRRVVSDQPPVAVEGESFLTPAALERAVDLKVRYALGRWVETEDACGMAYYPRRPEFDRLDEVPDYDPTFPRFDPSAVEYGWAGQNMRLGLSLWRWGRRKGDDGLRQRGLRVAGAWLRAAERAVGGGRPAPTVYFTKEERWCDVNGGEAGYARPTVEVLHEVALFCRFLRASGDPRSDWEQVLHALLRWYTEPCRLRSDGTVPIAWSSDGSPQQEPLVTVGVLLVAALAEASRLSGGKGWLPVAQSLMDRYADEFLESMRSYPHGSALDSGCEDMESGMYLLMAATALYEAEVESGLPDVRRLEQAKLAADWTLTWTYTWDVGLRSGTLLDAAGFRSSGMNDVSVQNRCLHVYTPAAEINKLSTLLGAAGASAEAEFYRAQARRMLIPQVRTVSRIEERWGGEQDGEQPEQYLQTNYVHYSWDPVTSVPRGGIGRLFVPWMTCWVMSVCLDFLEGADESFDCSLLSSEK